MQIHQGTHGRAGDGDYIRPYHCNVPGCGKSFTEKRNLNAHRRTRHTEVRLGYRTEKVGGREVVSVRSWGCPPLFRGARSSTYVYAYLLFLFFFAEQHPHGSFSTHICESF